MSFYRDKYLHPLFQRTIFVVCLLSFFSATASAQADNSNVTSTGTQLNPLFLLAIKNTRKPNPLLSQQLKPSKHELMYWPNFPLTAAQIAARDRKRKQSPGEQIAGDIIGAVVNSILYGKKVPVATIPRF